MVTWPIFLGELGDNDSAIVYGIPLDVKERHNITGHREVNITIGPGKQSRLCLK